MQTEQGLTPLFIIGTTVFITLLITFIAFILQFYQRKNFAIEQNMQKMRSDFEKTLLNSKLEVQEQTFHNISLEIHDNINHSLTVIKRRFMNISQKVSPPILEQVTDSIDDISKIMEDLSHISKALHTDFIKEHGLLNTLEMEINRIKQLGIFEILYEVNGEPVFMDDQKELVIFRIIQELLNNAIKHSQATFVTIMVNFYQKQMHIQLSDNGHGFEQKSQILKGTGQLNIMQRIDHINGACHIESLPGMGTVIRMKIPY